MSKTVIDVTKGRYIEIQHSKKRSNKPLWLFKYFRQNGPEPKLEWVYAPNDQSLEEMLLTFNELLTSKGILVDESKIESGIKGLALNP